MNNRMLVWLVFILAVVKSGVSYGDVIIAINGDELTGKIISVGNGVVSYLPEQINSEAPETFPVDSVFMVKYDDGRKVVYTRQKEKKQQQPDDNRRRYSAYVFCETGLFGLVNINEASFDPGVFTIGVTPSIDRRITKFLSLGVEYMILWAKAKLADDFRFLMNGNGVVRLSFPLHPKCNFLAQVNAGLSLWPGAQSSHQTEPTFFKDRLGWNIHGGLGLEYKATDNGSLVLFAGYNGNFSTRDQIPVTIDMLLLSIGPRIKF